MQPVRRLPLALVVCAIGLWCGAVPAERKSEEHPLTLSAGPLPIEGSAPSLDGAIEWINTPPLTLAQLRSKVVLVEFWTYTCINWRRTLPYVRAWAEKYQAQGLVVIGVHTPEFEFEKNIDNVQRAVKEIGITFPVAVDSEYAIWGAFKNQYWPALYFVDARGRIRHHQFGEGDYAQSEEVIQRLLAEAGHKGAGHALMLGGTNWGRSCRGLDHSEVPRNLPGLQTQRYLCLERRRAVGKASRLRVTREA